jgi:hypothetical protein
MTLFGDEMFTWQLNLPDGGHEPPEPLPWPVRVPLRPLESGFTTPAESLSAVMCVIMEDFGGYFAHNDNHPDFEGVRRSMIAGTRKVGLFVETTRNNKGRGG